MRISTIPQIYRHLNRWGEIIAVLGKYELATWIGRLGPEFAKDFLHSRGGESIARLSWETRVVRALTELGPTFIKLGQILSTRPDLVGVALADELQKLQTEVPADPEAVVRKVIETELGRPLGELFREFDPMAVASASIGQVHNAVLHSGEPVVVKVQRADIQQKIAVDMDILAGLAILADTMQEVHHYRPRAIVQEFQRTLRRELDFRRELRSLEEFARNFADDPTVRIPRPYPELSSRRVLTMERIDGVKFSDLERHPPADLNPVEVARRGANLYLEMIFCHGCYHADPHPGNLLLLPDGVIGLLDFGMVGRIDEYLHEQIGEMLLAVAERDPEHLAHVITRVGAVPVGLDRSALTVDVADFVAHYGNVELERFDLGGALREMTEMIRRYNIMLPAPIAMLLKVLITLEGTSKSVCPKFSLVEVMKPYHARIVWRRYSPTRRLKKLRHILADLEHLAGLMPRALIDLLQQVQSGKFDVHLDHRGLEPSVNRLVLGMLASALFLGSSLMVTHRAPPLVYGFSFFGVAGMLLSLFFGWRVWRAIWKSGRLDRPKE